MKKIPLFILAVFVIMAMLPGVGGACAEKPTFCPHDSLGEHNYNTAEAPSPALAKECKKIKPKCIKKEEKNKCDSSDPNSQDIGDSPADSNGPAIILPEDNKISQPETEEGSDGGEYVSNAKSVGCRNWGVEDYFKWVKEQKRNNSKWEELYNRKKLPKNQLRSTRNLTQVPVRNSYAVFNMTNVDFSIKPGQKVPAPQNITLWAYYPSSRTIIKNINSGVEIKWWFNQTGSGGKNTLLEGNPVVIPAVKEGIYNVTLIVCEVGNSSNVKVLSKKLNVTSNVSGNTS